MFHISGASALRAIGAHRVGRPERAPVDTNTGVPPEQSSHASKSMDTKADVYVLHGARLNDVTELMWRRDVTSVPIVGYIEEMGWFGPTIIGVCTGRDALIAAWSRNNRPKNICVQSVMQRDPYALYNDDTPHCVLVARYTAVLEHYSRFHTLRFPDVSPPAG